MKLLLHFYMAVVFTIFCCSWNGPSLASAKRSSGTLNTTQNWMYLDRFCFATKGGWLQYRVRYPKSMQVEAILTYFDSVSQWKTAYNDTLTCEQKLALLNPTNHQIVHLSPDPTINEDRGDCEEFQHENATWYQCEGNGSFYSMRPRWWYMAVANCNSTNGLYLGYELTMANGPPTDKWHYQFSFDEFYSWPETTLFLILQAIVFVGACVIACHLKKMKLYHKTYKLFLISCAAELAGTFDIWLHYDKYSRDGIGLPVLKIISMVYRQIAVILFVLLLLLVAKGYTITRAKLSKLSTIKVIVFILTYALIRMLMLTWMLVIFDPALVTYPSESLPGYFLAILDIIGWVWYMRSSYVTVRKYPLKRSFFTNLALPITLWFWAGPIVLVIANFVLDDWVREEVVLGVDYQMMIIGYLVFLWLTRPSSANKNFPYHVRTNQICDGMDPNFPHNQYEVHYMTRLASQIGNRPAGEVCRMELRGQTPQQANKPSI